MSRPPASVRQTVDMSDDDKSKEIPVTATLEWFAAHVVAFDSNGDTVLSWARGARVATIPKDMIGTPSEPGAHGVTTLRAWLVEQIEGAYKAGEKAGREAKRSPPFDRDHATKLLDAAVTDGVIAAWTPLGETEAFICVEGGVADVPVSLRWVPEMLTLIRRARKSERRRLHEMVFGESKPTGEKDDVQNVSVMDALTVLAHELDIPSCAASVDELRGRITSRFRAILDDRDRVVNLYLITKTERDDLALTRDRVSDHRCTLALLLGLDGGAAWEDVVQGVRAASERARAEAFRQVCEWCETAVPEGIDLDASIVEEVAKDAIGALQHAAGVGDEKVREEGRRQGWEEVATSFEQSAKVAQGARDLLQQEAARLRHDAAAKEDDAKTKQKYAELALLTAKSVRDLAGKVSR